MWIKLDRANWDGVDELTDGLAIVVQGNNLSFKIRSRMILGTHYESEQIFIDSDNNPKTGYSNRGLGQMGAEYLIEGGNLYRHRGNGWNWDFIARVNSEDVGEEELEIEFPRSLIQTGNTIRAKAILRDRVWSVGFQTDIASFTINNQNNNGGNNNNGLNVSRDGNNLTITINSPTVANANFATQDILIDTDNNSQTGYSTGRLGHIGAEYLIEGDRLYSHTNGGWRWNYIGRVNRSINGQTLTVTANTTNMNLGNTIRTTATLNSRNWRVLQRFGIDNFRVGNGNANRLSLREYAQIISDEAHRPVVALEFSPNNNYILVSIDAPGHLEYAVYDVRTNEPVFTASISDVEHYHQFGDEIEQLRFTSNSTVKYVHITYDHNGEDVITNYELVEYDFLTRRVQRTDVSSLPQLEMADIVAVSSIPDEFIVYENFAANISLRILHVADNEHINYINEIESHRGEVVEYSHIIVNGNILEYNVNYYNNNHIYRIDRVRYNLRTNQVISRYTQIFQ